MNVQLWMAFAQFTPPNDRAPLDEIHQRFLNSVATICEEEISKQMGQDEPD